MVITIKEPATEPMERVAKMRRPRVMAGRRGRASVASEAFLACNLIVSKVKNRKNGVR